MFSNLRWKGIMTLFFGLLSTHFLFDFIPLIYRPKVWWNDDLLYNYISEILYWSGFMLFIGLYVRSVNKHIIIESPAKQWGFMFIPFYNSILFMLAGTNIPKRKAKSALFGAFFLFWQLDLFFPWTLFHEHFDPLHYETSTKHFFEDLVGMIASTGMIVTWLIYVFSLKGENRWNEPPQLQTAHHRFIIRDLSRGIGPEQPVKWIILIPALLAFTFISQSRIDLLILNYINVFRHDYYLYSDRVTDSDFYLFIWSAILRTTAIISLAVLSYHVFRMLYGLNVGEAPSAGLAAGGWFIPVFQTYWNYAVFVIWRKHFENGTKDLALTSADNPDKRILRFTAIVFLIYMLRPIFYLIYYYVLQHMHYTEDDGVLTRYFKGFILECWSLLWGPNVATTFVTIALTAYILHVCELAEGLKKAALKKMVAMGEASPDAVRF